MEETHGEGESPDETSSRKGGEDRLCKGMGARGTGWRLQPAEQRVGDVDPGAAGVGLAGLMCPAGTGPASEPRAHGRDLGAEVPGGGQEGQPVRSAGGISGA